VLLLDCGRCHALPNAATGSSSSSSNDGCCCRGAGGARLLMQLCGTRLCLAACSVHSCGCWSCRACAWHLTPAAAARRTRSTLHGLLLLQGGCKVEHWHDLAVALPLLHPTRHRQTRLEPCVGLLLLLLLGVWPCCCCCR
jgi:hypothetical protein